MKKAICLWCKKEFYYGSSSTGKYCSNKCQNAKKKQELLEQWLSTGVLTNNSKWLKAPHAKWLREYLKEKQQNKCPVCGYSEWNNKEIPLVLDHINGDSEDNSPSNLRLLCPNCDAQSRFFKGKNKGRGRVSRIYKLLTVVDR